jgi:hypothetical protein
MIRHVVSWKLAATDDAQRELDAAAIIEGLESLPALIPEIIDFRVGRNVAPYDDNWDLTLIADYESLDALEVYQVHPEHVRVVGIVKPRVGARSNVDFEV